MNRKLDLKKDIKFQIISFGNRENLMFRNGPRKGIEIMLPETRDMADAWVVSFAGYVQSTPAS